MGGSSSSTSSAGREASGGGDDPADRSGFFDDGAPADEAGGAGPDGWAKAVVDGMPSDGEIADGTVVDAEIVDDTVVDAQIVDSTAVDSAPVDSAPVDTAAVDAGGDLSVEDLVVDLERVTAERDQYLDTSRRIQAEFENYRKQSLKREEEAKARANDSLVDAMLPILDAFDAAVAAGTEEVAPMRTTFADALTKLGLERIDPMDEPFDPTRHEAVMHEDADDTDGPVVAEVMRAGYTWKGRVLRPAMVRTRG